MTKGKYADKARNKRAADAQVSIEVERQRELRAALRGAEAEADRLRGLEVVNEQLRERLAASEARAEQRSSAKLEQAGAVIAWALRGWATAEIGFVQQMEKREELADAALRAIKPLPNNATKLGILRELWTALVVEGDVPITNRDVKRFLDHPGGRTSRAKTARGDPETYALTSEELDRFADRIHDADTGRVTVPAITEVADFMQQVTTRLKGKA